MPSCSSVGDVALNKLIMVYRPETDMLYPRLSKDIGEEGVVVLKMDIDEKGLVSKVEVSNSSGYPRLDKAASAFSSRIRFEPYKINGIPSKVNTSLSVQFKLKFGDFKADRRNNCKVFDPNPIKDEVIDFEGDCLDDFANGQGKAYWFNKDVLVRTTQGKFVKGKMDGIGLIQSYRKDDEFTYKGEIKDGLPNGKGEKIFKDGRSTGQVVWVNGFLQKNK